MFVTLRCTFIFRVCFFLHLVIRTAKIKYDYKFVFILTFFFQNRKMETSFYKNKFQSNTFSTEYSIILRIYSSKRASPVMKGDFKNKKVTFLTQFKIKSYFNRKATFYSRQTKILKTSRTWFARVNGLIWFD